MEKINLYQEMNDKIADLLLGCEDNGMCVYAGTYIKSLEEQLKSYKDLEKGQPQIDRWTPCSERMPESEKDVEITYVRKHWKTGEPLYFTARAFYEDGTINTEDSSFNWDNTDNWEYDEEKDGYVIPEGWFENVSFAEEFGAVDAPVIAWRAIIEPYKPAKEESAE